MASPQKTIIGTIVAQLRAKAAATRRKFILKKMPHPRDIKPLQREYFSQLSGILGELKRLTRERVIERMPAIIASVAANRPSVDGPRQDYTDYIESLMSNLRIQFYRKYSDDEIEAMARRQAQKVEAFNQAQLARQMTALLGVNPFVSESWLADEVKAFTKANVSYITSIPQQYFEKVQQSIIRNVQAGKLTDQIADDIKGIYNVTENRAALIARDQTSKFNGDLTRLRQANIGITRYVWSTSLDERVREEHAALEGQIFSWNDPPEVGNPGEDINCRCVALPVFEGEE